MTVLFTSITALVIGYHAVPLAWLLPIGLGYFFPLCLARYNQIMEAIERKKMGLATVYFVWFYMASLAGVSINYAVGKGARWLIKSFF